MGCFCCVKSSNVFSFFNRFLFREDTMKNWKVLVLNPIRRWCKFSRREYTIADFTTFTLFSSTAGVKCSYVETVVAKPMPPATRSLGMYGWLWGLKTAAIVGDATRFGIQALWKPCQHRGIGVSFLNMQFAVKMRDVDVNSLRFSRFNIRKMCRSLLVQLRLCTWPMPRTATLQSWWRAWNGWQKRVSWCLGENSWWFTSQSDGSCLIQETSSYGPLTKGRIWWPWVCHY